ncbi:MAG: citrate/2-methylcitrate synthase [Candidatus Heimdallarchaeaceae archaeon]
MSYMKNEKLNTNRGLLYYLIKHVRPELAEKVNQTETIETMIVGLGRQGTRHAQLMMEYGTNVTCGVAPGRGGTKVHETIPVYDSAEEAVKNHPDIAVASIWRHYSTAKDATIEVIRSGIPIVVLISEFIPLKDVRDILVEARKYKTILFGGNTPGIIFPPEAIKIGMLPDIFQAQITEDGTVGPKGVTILSRSGAILYHMSDALASAGIAQNGVLGVGGDGAIGSRFVDLVSLVMNYTNTDLVVVAGEIGGMQEELLAQDMIDYPEKYPKPLVALISGANAPEGKTMGHAGAVIAPGQKHGTFNSKKEMLEKAGATVVNHQKDLIEAVKTKLNRTYFEIDSYYQRMKKKWDEKSPEPTWGTLITKVVPNNLIIRGYPLQEIIAKKGLLETAHLLIDGEFPDGELQDLEDIAIKAAKEEFLYDDKISKESDVSKLIGTFLLLDDKLSTFAQSEKNPSKVVTYSLGRVLRYLSIYFGNVQKIDTQSIENLSFSELLYLGLVGEMPKDKMKIKLLEAIITACVDHGVTPPSAQATLILATTRANYEVAISAGIQAITDVHGGAGQKAAEFMLSAVKLSKENSTELQETTFELIKDTIKSGKRIEGLGHRIHTQDPRRDVLWNLSEKAGYAKECVAVSKIIGDAFYRVRGMNLPINVDGVIGAIIADMDIDPKLAKAVFVFGRTAGLAAHYYEEITTQPQMRRIVFDKAIYKGQPIREIPE